MRATTVNHRDVWIRKGHPHPAYHVVLPAILGIDISGEIVGVGQAVEGFSLVLSEIQRLQRRLRRTRGYPRKAGGETVCKRFVCGCRLLSQYLHHSMADADR